MKISETLDVSLKEALDPPNRSVVEPQMVYAMSCYGRVREVGKSLKINFLLLTRGGSEVRGGHVQSKFPLCQE